LDWLLWAVTGAAGGASMAGVVMVGVAKHYV